jgi:hypothetical protein
MIRLPDCLAVFAVTVLCGFLPIETHASSSTAPLGVSYLDEAALVFWPETTGQLPNSIFIPAVPLTYASEIRLACQSVYARNGDPLVFLSGTRICVTLTELFDLARELHPEQVSFGVTEQDRQQLTKSLEIEKFVLMRPKAVFQPKTLPDGVAAALVCYCPNPPTIFADGFETTL